MFQEVVAYMASMSSTTWKIGDPARKHLHRKAVAIYIATLHIFIQGFVHKSFIALWVDAAFFRLYGVMRKY